MKTKMLMVRFLLVLGLAAGMFSFSVSETLAASCSERTPSEHIEDTDVIFLGIAGAEAGGSRDDKKRIVRFEVLRSFKGAKGRTIDIEYMNDHGGNTGWGFAPGKPVFVFAANPRRALNKDPTAPLVYFCSMAPFHGRKKLHNEYWKILWALKN
ncbi:hypothetical protein [Roseibium aggregatum]|uniref:Uncharacterized protein n=1 Tax=Roseibium aggregatum TaxID=187304 RepID=A0A939J2T5_9HYPH|nr:hypothetical protein [Roseibium aggregatum]MBN9671758.1 hypothetical protein [Roseibium aggregatum]